MKSTEQNARFPLLEHDAPLELPRWLAGVENHEVGGISLDELVAFQTGVGTPDLSQVFFLGEAERTALYPAQGSRRKLPITGTLREVIPRSLARKIALTGGISGPLGKQFVAQPQAESLGASHNTIDFLHEESYAVTDENGEVVPGLTHKYGERVLATFTYDCAAYCRFCTRGRHVGGSQHALGVEQIERALDWIDRHSQAPSPTIREVILSGGDPFVLPPALLERVTKRLGELQQAGQLDTVRIGTRLPIHAPEAMQPRHYEAIQSLVRPTVLIHCNHPAEITAQEQAVFDALRQAGAILRSHTVLLAGVNDSAEVMHRLMRKLVRAGVVPYYVFMNDENFWNQHFTVSVDRAREIFSSFRQNASGLESSFTVAIDVGGGRGKIPIPVGELWDVDFSQYRDFDGLTFPTR